MHKGSGWLALAIAMPTIVTGMLTLDMQEGIALPAASHAPTAARLVPELRSVPVPPKGAPAGSGR